MERWRRIRTVLVATLAICMLAGVSARADAPYIRKVWFHDRDRGWFTGYAPRPDVGFVLGKTVNGGRTWALTTGLPNGGPEELLFVDADVGWASYHWVFGTRIMATRDGGETWTLQVDSPEAILRDISFTGRRVGWTRASTDIRNAQWIIRTEDGGETWEGVAEFVRGLG